MDHRGDSVKVPRDGSIDYWQFLGHPDGDSQDIPGCSLWRFLELVDGVREEIHVLFKREKGVKEGRVHKRASTEAETRDRVQRDVVAFLRALGGPVEFRGVRFKPEDVEIVGAPGLLLLAAHGFARTDPDPRYPPPADLPTAPSAPPALSVTLRGIWRPVRRDVTETNRGTRRFGQEVTRPDGYLRWAFVLPGGEADPREGHEPVRIKGRGTPLLFPSIPGRDQPQKRTS
ncbi:hypothetical protein DMC30DRAFT_387751 [Rhodotorula diobovata]|uniref:Uncharacterized protein n=1 Tax=Rhodotorula diobovata TaxID=5288 RepID=A0A5C5G6S6_9BASI|nr:hypothetical protein DMC30DRAFT_387751 [Rhodotorula diobovata]